MSITKPIPTASEFSSRRYQYDIFGKILTEKEMLIEFAKMHVSAALTAAQFYTKLRIKNPNEPVDYAFSYECGDDEITVDNRSLRQSYPLTKIK